MGSNGFITTNYFPTQLEMGLRGVSWHSLGSVFCVDQNQFFITMMRVVMLSQSFDCLEMLSNHVPTIQAPGRAWAPSA